MKVIFLSIVAAVFAIISFSLKYNLDGVVLKIYYELQIPVTTRGFEL